MDNYVKGETRILEEGLPFDEATLTSDPILMRVRAGSKVANLLPYAMKNFANETKRTIVFSGFGPACQKVVSIAEVFKRSCKILIQQLNVPAFRRIEEYWEPQIEGIDRLKVNRDVPALFVLFTKDQLATSLVGRQGGIDGSAATSAWVFDDRQSDSVEQSARSSNPIKRRPGKNGDGTDGTNRWKRKPKAARKKKDNANAARSKDVPSKDSNIT